MVELIDANLFRLTEQSLEPKINTHEINPLKGSPALKIAPGPPLALIQH